MKYILLSFDVEEFDLPLEYGQNIPVEEQLAIGKMGLDQTLKIIEPFAIPTTLYTTAFFASHFPEVIRQLSHTHEIASHAYFHTHFSPQDLRDSRSKLVEITGKEVLGFRMPRLAHFDYLDLIKAGYLYDSSLNPTYIPGRYNHLSSPTRPFVRDNIWILPTSVTPLCRIPLFWLSFKNFPMELYLFWAKYTLEKQGFLNLYFHPWEFTDISKYKLPFYIQSSPQEMQRRLQKLLTVFSKIVDATFMTTHQFLEVIGKNAAILPESQLQGPR